MFLAAAVAALILPVHTPGVRNPAVTQTTIKKTVCIRGWTATIRPPYQYTLALKEMQIGAWGYTNREPRAYEEDHFVPLELGGAPRDPRNLWPEPWAQADKSDPLENRLHAQVCAGQITLTAARRQIVRFKRIHG